MPAPVPHKQPSVYDLPCPLMRALMVISGKWKLPLLWALASNSAESDSGNEARNQETAQGLRYGELKRAVTGITDTMLNKCLAELERDGCLLRTEVTPAGWSRQPRRVVYRLSARGSRLMRALSELQRFGEEQGTDAGHMAG